MEGLKLSLFLCSLLCISVISHASDTLNKTRILTDGQTIVSSGETFEMGFFSPPGNSKNRYVGIWYKKIPVCTVVWVANRETPVTDTRGVLKLVDPGILVLVNGTNDTVWSTNTSTSTPIHAKKPVVKLLDSGNLVVKEANEDVSNSNFIWQSFDYPTDTLLPGMKLGKDLVTGLERSLSSWKTEDNPAQGDKTYKLDPKGYPQFFWMKGSREFYRTGPWNGEIFGGTPNQERNTYYTFGLVLDETEVYYHFDLVNVSILSRLVMTAGAGVMRYIWVDRNKAWTTYMTSTGDNCDLYNFCGPYASCNISSSPICTCLTKFVPKHRQDWENDNWSGGCVWKTPLDCPRDRFVKFPGYKLPDTRYSLPNNSMTFKECESLCLRNCSCVAYSNLDVRRGGSGCLVWFDKLVDIRVLRNEVEHDGRDIYIRMAYSDSEDLTDSQGGPYTKGSSVPQVGSGGKKKKIVGVILGSFIGILLLGLTLILYLRSKKRTNVPESAEKYFTGSKEDLELPLFDLNVIIKATNNFSVENKLGEGGFGPVYKGMLEVGQEIAVKRLSKSSSQGPDEFKNEVVYIARLQHRNLVKLLGCCMQGDEKMLIYEYMPNKSLDYFIFDPMRSTILDWLKRSHIIIGIARGLLYLHQDSRLRIIHRDLKASNILLDNDMNAKISDFGTARSFQGNEIEANTLTIVGTYGYMSPEYAIDGVFSLKSDVFSFGVLVLEIISGKRNRGFCHTEHGLNLLGHAWQLYNEERLVEFIDESLRNSMNKMKALRSIHIGLLCVQQSPRDRPSMDSVILMLGSDIALRQPKQPGFFTERNIREDCSSSSKVATTSACEITHSLTHGR